ncbi:sterol desaturase family protein, partial [Leptospira sp. id769339]
TFTVLTLAKDQSFVFNLMVIFISGLVIWGLEKLFPFEKEWLTGWDWGLDIGYYLVNYGIKIIAIATLSYLGNLTHSTIEWFPTFLPYQVQVILALLIIDFFLYWVHRISHMIPWMWNLHSIHHSSERLYFLNGEKRHALHQILEGGPGILVCFAIGVPSNVLSTTLAFLAVNMFLQHTNLNYRAGFFKKIFCVAELHRWHHRQDYYDAQVNYGACFAIWDYIFRTSFDSSLSKNALGKVGIKEEPEYPRTYIKQFLRGFRIE